MEPDFQQLLQAYRERRAVDGTYGAFNAAAFEAAEKKVLNLEARLGLPAIDVHALVAAAEGQ